MFKFAFKRIEAVKGKQQFKQLVLLSDSEDQETIQKYINDVESGKIGKGARYDQLRGVLDEYENRLQDSYRSSFNRIISFMDLICNNQTLPKKKFRDITPAGETIKEYEIKYGDLRVYVIKIPNGKLVVLCGYKNQQSRDISKFRSLKEKVLPFI